MSRDPGGGGLFEKEVDFEPDFEPPLRDIAAQFVENTEFRTWITELSNGERFLLALPEGWRSEEPEQAGLDTSAMPDAMVFQGPQKEDPYTGLLLCIWFEPYSSSALPKPATAGPWQEYVKRLEQELQDSLRRVLPDTTFDVRVMSAELPNRYGAVRLDIFASVDGNHLRQLHYLICGLWHVAHIVVNCRPGKYDDDVAMTERIVKGSEFINYTGSLSNQIHPPTDPMGSDQQEKGKGTFLS